MVFGSPAASVSKKNPQGKQFLREASGRLSDFYVRVRDLGEGAYGEVFLARQRILAGSHERDWSRAGFCGGFCRVSSPLQKSGRRMRRGTTDDNIFWVDGWLLYGFLPGKDDDSS